jgi:hypothetical protein
VDGKIKEETLLAHMVVLGVFFFFFFFLGVNPWDKTGPVHFVINFLKPEILAQIKMVLREHLNEQV